VADMAAPRVK